MAIHNHSTDLKDPVEHITSLSTLELIALVSPLCTCDAATQEEERDKERENELIAITIKPSVDRQIASIGVADHQMYRCFKREGN